MKISSSMYEVFHWFSTPEPTRKPIQRAKSLSCAPGSESKTTLAKTGPQLQFATELNLNIMAMNITFQVPPTHPQTDLFTFPVFCPVMGGTQ